jgi:hypothetical protein
MARHAEHHQRSAFGTLTTDSSQVKATTRIFATLIAVLLAAAGCKKQTALPPPKTLEEGVAQLRTALLKASPKVQNDLYSGVDYGVRYGNYKEAAAALDRIASDPGLNEQQKKLVNEVIELLKPNLQNPQTASKPAR